MKFHIALLAAGLAAALAGQAAAQSFRCQNDLVNVGDSRAAALQKCGQPVVRDAYCKAVPAQAAPGVAGAVAACVNIDEWTYNPGYGQFMTTLRFEDGKLVAITYGDRVK